MVVDSFGPPERPDEHGPESESEQGPGTVGRARARKEVLVSSRRAAMGPVPFVVVEEDWTVVDVEED